jgi:large subunit ribosomal protein L9
MEVILMEKVENLGDIGELVKVRSGYGRNFLIPKGKAKPATKENIAAFEVIRAELEAKAVEAITAATARAEKLQTLELTLTHKVGAEGKLFGSVGTADIADACTEAGVPVERREVLMIEGTTIRTVGVHAVTVRLHSDVEVSLRVMVVGEDMTPEEIAAMAEIEGTDETADAATETATETATEDAADITDNVVEVFVDEDREAT